MRSSSAKLWDVPVIRQVNQVTKHVKIPQIQTALKTGGPAGAFLRRQRNASPLVLARDVPAEKPQPPLQGSGTP